MSLCVFSASGSTANTLNFLSISHLKFEIIPGLLDLKAIFLAYYCTFFTSISTFNSITCDQGWGHAAPVRYLIKGLPRDTSLIRKCASFLRRERWAWQPFWGWFWLLWEYDKIDGQSSWKDKIVIWGKDQSRQQFPCTDTFVKKYNSLEIKEHLLFWPLSFQAYVLRKGISGGFCQKGNMCFLSLTLHRCMDR